MINTYALAALLSWFMGTAIGVAAGCHHGILGAVLGLILGCAIGFCVSVGVFWIENRYPYRFRDDNKGIIRDLLLTFTVMLFAPILSSALSFIAVAVVLLVVR
jgi:hypothetical protein